jgi:Kef-type K+ transport system membrane component KefB
MFVVGLSFAVDIIQKHLRSSIAVSLAGMVVPFVLGSGLAWIFFHHTALFPARTTLSEAMLFLGASMCIQAFPMLALISHFKNLAGPPRGTAELGAGTIECPGMDLLQWCWQADLGPRLINIIRRGLCVQRPAFLRQLLARRLGW